MMKISFVLLLLVDVMILVTLIENGKGLDNVYDVVVTDITRSSVRLEWEWFSDNDDANDAFGCVIVTRMVDKRMKVVHEVEIRNVVTNYTIRENMTSWERYESCITPILPNGSSSYDAACSGYYITEYDPWTRGAETAVIVSAGLLFALLVAVAINFIWPREKQRTFSMDSDEGVADEARKTVDEGAKTNLGFLDDEDNNSVVNDWNAAATAALSQQTHGGKRWIKKDDNVHHKSSKALADLEALMYDDVNYNYRHQPTYSIHTNEQGPEISDVVYEEAYEERPGHHHIMMGDEFYDQTMTDRFQQDLSLLDYHTPDEQQAKAHSRLHGEPYEELPGY